MMRFHQRTMLFSSLSNEGLVISKVRQIAEKVCSWNEEDWSLFDAPWSRMKVDTKASDAQGGVAIEFAGWGGQGRDGGLEIDVVDEAHLLVPTGKRLVWTTTGSRREIAEDVLFKLVLEEVRVGGLSKVCSLALDLHPQSSETARRALVLENRRLRKELQELQGRGEWRGR